MKSLSEAVNDRLSLPAAAAIWHLFKRPESYRKLASACFMPEGHELPDALTAPVFDQRIDIFRLCGPVDPCLQFLPSQICLAVTALLHPNQLRGIHASFLPAGLMADSYGSAVSREVFLQFVGTVPKHMKLALKHFIRIRFPVTFRASGTQVKSIRMNMKPFSTFPAFQFRDPMVRGMYRVSRKKFGKLSRIIGLHL